MVTPGWFAKPARRVRAAWFVIVPSLLAAAVLSIAVVHLLATGGSRPAAANSNSPGTAPGTVSPNPDATESPPRFHVPAKVIAITAPPADALPLPRALKAQARTWDAGRGGAALAVVSSQVGAVMQAAGLREYVTMKAECAQLAVSVATAQASPPIPDAAMQTLYASALSELARGAEECRAAISQKADGDEYNVTTENSAILRASASAFVTGSKNLYRATAQIQFISRSH
jgi:hypothetical protein